MVAPKLPAKGRLPLGRWRPGWWPLGRWREVAQPGRAAPCSVLTRCAAAANSRGRQAEPRFVPGMVLLPVCRARAILRVAHGPTRRRRSTNLRRTEVAAVRLARPLMGRPRLIFCGPRRGRSQRTTVAMLLAPPTGCFTYAGVPAECGCAIGNSRPHAGWAGGEATVGVLNGRRRSAEQGWWWSPPFPGYCAFLGGAADTGRDGPFSEVARVV